MKTVIVGPGAIGSLFAASLARAACDVVLLDKDPARARRVAASGILVDGWGLPQPVRVDVTADPARVGEADFLCLCVKSYDTRAAITHARPAIGPRTVVVSLQNGLGNLESVSEVFDGPMVCAVTSHGSTFIEPGHVVHAGAGDTAAAGSQPAYREAAAAFVAMMTSAGMEAALHENARCLLWGKLIVNAAINPVTAVWDVLNGAILERDDLRSSAFGAAKEAERVARAKCIPLPYPDAVSQVELVCRTTRSNVSSMLQDIRRGKKTEVDAITGAIVREARAVAVPTPISERLLRLVGEKEAAVRNKAL